MYQLGKNRFLFTAGMAIAIAMALPASGIAQETPRGQGSFGDPVAPAPTAPATTADAGAPGDTTATSPQAQGPVRMARFSYLSGDVDWRTDETAAWSQASLNLPIRQGAQITVPNGGRAEIQFDDGSLLRLSGGSYLTLLNLYSDDKGEYTELKLNDGTASLNLRNGYSVYQLDTADGSVKSTGPSHLRVDATHDLRVGVQDGKATVENGSGETSLNGGDFAEATTPDAAPRVLDLPSPDDWDQFCQSRDQLVAQTDSHVPDNISLVSGDLNEYGTWHDDPVYGQVWAPVVVTPGWRPYHDGHWVWVSPFGWTWVADEPWGWAPYHYGTWIDEPYGWAWVPGPRYQYWSPAVVSFTSYGGYVGWAPLCPREVHYPSEISLGFWRGGWGAYFSIGGAAVYYSAGGGYCSPRPWNNYYANRTLLNISIVDGGRFGGPGFGGPGFGGPGFDRHPFVPFNSRFGGTQASIEAFRGNGRFEPLSPAGLQAFRTNAPMVPTGGHPLAGPLSVRPTLNSVTVNRTFADRPSFTPRHESPVYRAAAVGFSRTTPINIPGTRSYTPARRGYGGSQGVGSQGGGSQGGGQRGGTNGRGPQAYRSSDANAIAGSGRSTSSHWTPGSLSPAEAASRARQSLHISGSSYAASSSGRGFSSSGSGRSASGGSSGYSFRNTGSSASSNSSSSRGSSSGRSASSDYWSRATSGISGAPSNRGGASRNEESSWSSSGSWGQSPSVSRSSSSSNSSSHASRSSSSSRSSGSRSSGSGH